MPTIKKRINISVSQDIDKMLSKLAIRDDVPLATKAAELLERALEIEEDEVWDSIASERAKTATIFVSHKDAWK